MRIYLDLVVILNFLVDFLLLLGTNRLAGFPSEPKKLLTAAALGGIYGGACLLPGFRFLGGLLWRLVSLGAMAVIAFGLNRSAIKRCGVFILLTMALGGIALGLGGGGFGTVVASALCVWLLCRVAFGGGAIGTEYVTVQIRSAGRSVSLTALRDTGNTLRDPVTGEPVLIIGCDAAETLTGLSPAQLASPLETLAARPVPGLRLIPYHAVGCANGMMLAMRFRDVRIGQRRQSALVAFAPEGLGRGEVYQALTGGV